MMHFKLSSLGYQKLFGDSVSSDFKDMFVSLFCFVANNMHIKKHFFLFLALRPSVQRSTDFKTHISTIFIFLF